MSIKEVELDHSARHAAAGAAALVVGGHDADARKVLALYLSEALPLVGPMAAMTRLVAALLGVIVATADEDRVGMVAAELVANGGEWT